MSPKTFNIINDKTILDDSYVYIHILDDDTDPTADKILDKLYLPIKTPLIDGDEKQLSSVDIMYFSLLSKSLPYVFIKDIQHMGSSCYLEKYAKTFSFNENVFANWAGVGDKRPQFLMRIKVKYIRENTSSVRGGVTYDRVPHCINGVEVGKAHGLIRIKEQPPSALWDDYRSSLLLFAQVKLNPNQINWIRQSVIENEIIGKTFLD